MEEHCSLFNSWSWCNAWWETWGKSQNLKLQLYTLHDQDNTLLAILPFYIVNIKSRLGLTTRQLQVIGNIYPTGITILSEYSDIVCSTKHEKEVKCWLPNFFSQLKFDELIVPYTTRDCTLYNEILSSPPPFVWVSHYLEGTGVSINTKGTFDDYLKGLGKNTRLKLFNRRTHLEKLGVITFATTSENELSESFDELNKFHVARWNNKCYGVESLNFHHLLAKETAKHDKLLFTKLIMDGSTLSVAYNIKFNHKEYNLQAGYIEDFDKKISLGTLHLGYCIQNAFADNTTQEIDLLFGSGKNSDYKKRLNGSTSEFYTLRCFKTKRAILKYWAAKVFSALRFSVS